MTSIPIPDELFEEIKEAAPDSMSLETFIADAIRNKIVFEERKKEFYRLSDQAQAALKEKGLSEAEILADFESFREDLVERDSV